jgi:hypothetical protein
MEHQISLTDEEVREIIESHIRTIAAEFTAGRDVYVSASSYTGMAAKATISEPVDSGEKEA